ncbi:uncharacterized protein BcabD6B2_26950 [Babesia caballi]|uniref:Uncharacterized protein n=1 Tax=Babesia caballi TaxID=5871 RepID=A0AAV4LU39_BABCB|nr:hypothetical protein BcabD6B2_26950 [Babesia caballi]
MVPPLALRVVRRQDSDLLGDRLSRQLVVPRNHKHPYAGLPRNPDGTTHLWPGRVQNARKPKENEALLNFGKELGAPLRNVPLCSLALIQLQRILGLFGARESDGAQSTLRHRLDLLHYVLLDTVTQRVHAPVGLHVHGAALHHRLRRALGVKFKASIHAGDNTHHLSVPAEFQRGLLAELFLVLPRQELVTLSSQEGVKVVHHVKNGPLSGLALLRFHRSLGAHGPALEQLVHELLQTAGESLRVAAGVIDGPVPVKVNRPERVSRIQQLQHLCSHLVRGERAGLVRANDGGAAQRLHRGQPSHNGVSLRHVPRTQRQTRGDNGGKTFGDGGHRQCDGDFEIVDAPLEDAAVHRVAEVAEVDDPHGHADEADELGKRHAEVVEHPLQRRVPLLQPRLEHGGLDGADLRGHASRHHDAHTRPGGDRHPNVSWHLVPRADAYNVSDHEAGRVDGGPLPVPEARGHRGLQLLERVQRLLRVRLLPDADKRVEHQNHEDHQRLDEVRDGVALADLGEGEDKADHRRSEQNLDQHVVKLPQEERQQRLPLLLHQDIGAEILQSSFDSLCVQPLFERHFVMFQNVFHAFNVRGVHCTQFAVSSWFLRRTFRHFDLALWVCLFGLRRFDLPNIQHQLEVQTTLVETIWDLVIILPAVLFSRDSA